MLFAQGFEVSERIGWQHARGMRLQELIERIVQGRAAIGGAEFGLQRIERLQPQDAPRIEAIGIAPPLLDARDREPGRPRFDRRPGLGPRPWLVIVRPVDRLGPGEPRSAAALDILRRRPAALAIVVEQRIEPRQPARRHGGRAALALGAGQQHALGGERRGEVVRRQADTPFRLRQAEGRAHRPVDPRAGLDRGRPGAFVQPAQDQEIGALQTGFQRTPDRKPWMPAEARPHHLGRQHGVEQGRPVAAGDGGVVLPRRAQAGQCIGQCLAGLARPQPVRRVQCVRRRQRWRRAAPEAPCSVAICAARSDVAASSRSIRSTTRRRSASSPNFVWSTWARSAARPEAGFRPRRHLAIEPARGVEQGRARRGPASRTGA